MPTYIKKKYTPHYDNIAKYLHWCALKDRDMPVPDQLYLHKIPTKQECKVAYINDHTKLMWDTTARVDCPVEVN
eukprot:1443832-Ditylum_brightwellii.AAC.1